MQGRPQLPIEVSPAAFFPPRMEALVRPLEPALLRWAFPDRLVATFPTHSAPFLSCAEYCRRFLQNLNVATRIDDKDLARIPQRGAALVVANHPFGFLEGMMLLALLEQVRPDYKIVANRWLAKFPPLRERLIFVDNMGAQGKHENSGALRSSLTWLRGEGLLVMFPAGEVAHMNWAQGKAEDAPWNTAAARLARKTGCPTVPLFFAGANSLRFHLLGALHPSLRTLYLGQELMRQSSRTVTIRTGNVIPGSVLQTYSDANAATSYLRARTCLLANRGELSDMPRHRALPFMRQAAIAASTPTEQVKREVASLAPDRLLAASEDFAVYLADAAEIPNTLHEIGRAREIAYRAVGEGTGRAIDLDEFDGHYQHVILWHKGNGELAGAYRLAATPDVLASHGVKGLYTNTLFHFGAPFLERIGAGFELGRSFILPQYQKQYAPLLLLWKGILRHAAQRPECATLFGAVSVSREYGALSRRLIVNFLNGHAVEETAHLIRPRKLLRSHPLLPKPVKDLGRLLPTADELSSSIQDLESDGKGLPVLLKQYLKIGGQLLGSNVDPNFSDTLDVLVMADLRTASGPMLDRCMGRDAAASFRAFHAAQPA